MDAGMITSLIEVLGNPISQTTLVILSVIAAITRYVAGAIERNDSSKELRRVYGFNDVPFALINVWPHRIHMFVSVVILAFSALQAFLLFDTFVLKSEVQKGLPEWSGPVVQSFNDWYAVLIVVGLILFVYFELRFIEKLFSLIIRVFPCWKNTYGWVNAEWQLRPEEARRILFPSDKAVTRIAGTVVNALTEKKPNKSLSLRPHGLVNEDAANILYFGHVVEAYCGPILKLSYNWMVFYDGLANVAGASDAPFSPVTISNHSSDVDFMKVLLRANKKFPKSEQQIPDDVGLGIEVNKAFNTLRNRFRSSALNCVGIGGSFNYEHVLQYANCFLDEEEMRRQFAKLFVIWNLKPEISRPESFHFAFSKGIFVKYLDENVLRHRGDHFNCGDEFVQICFNKVQDQVVQETLRLLEDSKKAEVITWIENEKNDVESRNADWNWWIRYRADQHTYYLGKEHVSEVWAQDSSDQIKKK